MPPQSIVTFPNHKGGGGKSFLATTWSGYMAAKGHQVLLIDACSLRGQNFALGLPKDDRNNLLYYLRDEVAAEAIVKPTNVENLDLVQAHKDLTKAPGEIKTWGSIKRLIREVGDNYDHVVIDSSPNSDVMAQAALYASTAFAIPTTPDLMSLGSGIEATDELVAAVHNVNSDLKDLGIIMTAFDHSKAMHRAMLDALRTDYGNRLIEPAIRISAYVQHALYASLPLTHFPEARQSKAFHGELMAVMQQLEAKLA